MTIPCDRIIGVPNRSGDMDESALLKSNLMSKYRLSFSMKKLQLHFLGITRNCTSTQHEQYARFSVECTQEQIQCLLESAVEIFDLKEQELKATCIGEKYDWIGVRAKSATAKIWTVSLWDGSDRVWTVQKSNLTHDEAQELWNKYTANGTRSTTYADGDYFIIARM